jgi:heat shock protein HslJ
MAGSPLRNTYWKLVRLDGAPVEAPVQAPVDVVPRQHEPHLVFALDEMRVSGSGGCNRVTGPIEIDGDMLHLRRLASTRMACAVGMEQELRFLRALGTVERYAIRGTRLELFDAAGTIVAAFEAVASR